MNHVTYRTILKTGPWYENYQIVYMSCLYGIVKKNKKINYVFQNYFLHPKLKDRRTFWIIMF